jgi:hypothetical protein
MKTKLTLTFLLSFSFYLLSSQVPQGFNYQAVAHNSAGAPIMSTTIQVKMGILSDTTAPVVVWEELHSTVKTNIYGVFNLVIGTGVRQSGSAQNFSDIDWTNAPLFLKIQINYQGAWKNMGNAKLWSVPYAMVTNDIGAPLKKLAVTGETDNLEEALFEVKNKDGQTIFAVYNEGVRVYVDDGDEKGVKGGFAIGGFGTTKAPSQPYFIVKPDSIRMYLYDTVKAVKGGFAIGGYGKTKGGSQNYLFVSSDSIRAYIDTASVKGVKGGFAIGGFDKTKSPGEEYFRVTHDSTRIYIDKAPSTKGKKGGFAIGGFGTVKSPKEEYLRVTRDSTRIITSDPVKGFAVGSITTGVQENYLKLNTSNYFIGHEAGKRITTGLYNSIIGYRSGSSLTSGSFNSFLGYEAGYSNTIGNSNIIMGYKSGFANSTGSYNIFLGDSAGVSNTTGEINLFMGYKAGAGNTTGVYNIFLGDSSGVSNTIGGCNVFMGPWAGYQNTTGGQNIIIGIAGYENTTGYQNIIMGTFAGTYNHDGFRNVYIGDRAGLLTSGGMNNVFIGANAGRSADSSNNSVLIGTNAGYNSSGWHNVYLGAESGAKNEFGNSNVFIGYQAGKYDTLSNRLYIANTSTLSPLIFGEFDNNRVVISGNSSHNISNRTFFVNGSAGGLESWYNDSDRRLKHDIATIPDALQKVLKLRGVNFLWNMQEEGMDDLQMGFIGQEAAEVIPEVVSIVNDHYSMQYAPVTALLVEAIKDQQKQIDDLKSLVNSLITSQTGK